MSVVVVLDIGTSKLCALALCTKTARPLAVRSCANNADVEGLPAGRHEQNPARIAADCRRLLKEVLAETPGAEVAGIGFSGQMHGVLLVDKANRPLTNLITWRDQRTLEQEKPGSLNGALERLNADTTRRAGCKLSAGYGGATLHWLAANGQLRAGCIALTIADFVAASLSGAACTEPTHAASWGILDAASREWDAASIARLGIPAHVLPAIRPSGAPTGEVLADVAIQLGLPPGVKVSAPVGDNQASVIGAAGLSGKAAVVNLGTGGQVSVPCDEYMYVAELETRPMPIDGYILVGASLCGGWSYAYLNRFYRELVQQIAGVNMTEADIYASMNALAAAAPDGSADLKADTRFSGTRADADLRGCFADIDCANLTAANMTRAVLEGMVGELADVGRLCGLGHLSHIVAGGNAVRRNPLVVTIIEKAFGLPCRLGQAGEDAAMGAALCTAVRLGLLAPEAVDRAASA
ncbi:MAG: hypothetical protein HQ592_01900 [Planctomycetes bacterium]|nr:hypothetical protein [Planctomycetota bacterium]